MMKISIYALLFFLAILLGGCANNRQDHSKNIRKVKIEEVFAADTLKVETFTGIISETAEIDLGFRVAGSIREILVNEGDMVYKGQLIAIMDNRDYEIQYQVAQAQYDQVKAEAERVIELYNRKSVARNDYDKAVAGLRMVEAQLKHARNQLNDTRLHSPIAGFVQKINFVTNEMVDAGMPVVSIIDTNLIFVYVDIPATLFLRLNQVTSIRGINHNWGNIPIELKKHGVTKKANQNQLHQLRLSVIRPFATQLIPGLGIEVEITTRITGNVGVSILPSAIFYRDGQTFVWVYNAESQTVNNRQVYAINNIVDGRVQISRGLTPGELVVIAGVSFLRENEIVQPLEPVSETNIGGLL